MGTYYEAYEHDSEGNILSLAHSLADQKVQGWTRTYMYTEPSLLQPDKFNNRLSSTTIAGV
jgi:hypothetical protein